ncbi:hypothetical protein GJ179_11635 [Salmonella enterica subsp. enterica]|nr:hypothetical protein [Salmonella enterica]EEI1253470.1 hypothetical protein [Salmonella enterica subsp. enterica]EEL2516759.1 hypothetical protein [Salmonella enterica]EEO4172612.1 hypothetical protein [Salmonella enterica subsp. enterica]EIO8741044.1 hypothetical protein [Salmonella enterica]
MKICNIDDNLTVFSRLEKEAERLGLNHCELVQLLQLNGYDYMCHRNGMMSLDCTLFSSSAFSVLKEAGMDMFYITTGVPHEANHTQKALAMALHINDFPVSERRWLMDMIGFMASNKLSGAN